MKKFSIIIFIFITISLFGQETNRQFSARIIRMNNEEWNSLVFMLNHFIQEKDGRAMCNLNNYMMGFAEAMYLAGEYLHDTYQGIYDVRQYAELYRHYFGVYQELRELCGPDTEFFRSLFYYAGFDRVQKNTRRYTEYDFQ